ncbi:MAG: MlaD family protein [Rubrivivax sp.]|nr:MlaD family protein [Rubrivivax sp.]
MRLAAWRVGLFALLGLVLLAVTTVLATGGWFAASERAVMRFDSSVFGLQTGAPVVFRGVRVGQVTAIGFAPAAPGASAAPGGLAVPVTAEFDRDLVRELQAAAGGTGTAARAAGAAASAAVATASVGSNTAVKALVARGLVARLALQSLLTGQLYVDLDFDADSAALPLAAALSPGGLPLIPTTATRLQTLQAQLEGLDLAQIGRDVAAVAASARQLLAGPEPARALARTADAAQALEKLALRLERDIAPLARAAQGSFTEGRRALQDLGAGARQFGVAAQQVAGAASQVQALARGGTPVLAEVQRAAAELGRAAASLRAAAGEDSALRGEAERALQDVSRAARALREVGETLERHPDALLRGRASPP